MNEAETRAELIDPALKAAGWGVVEGSRVNREMICPGRILGAGIVGREAGELIQIWSLAIVIRAPAENASRFT